MNGAHPNLQGMQSRRVGHPSWRAAECPTGDDAIPVATGWRGRVRSWDRPKGQFRSRYAKFVRKINYPLKIKREMRFFPSFFGEANFGFFLDFDYDFANGRDF